MYASYRLAHPCLQLGIVLGAIYVSLTTPSSVRAGQLSSRIPVAVKLVGDDGLTQVLTSALKSKILNSKNLALSQNTAQDVFLISSESNVNWDSLSGKNVIIYHVQLTKAGRLVGDKVGVCFEKQADKCASDIVDQFGRIIAVRG